MRLQVATPNASSSMKVAPETLLDLAFADGLTFLRKPEKSAALAVCGERL